VAGDVFRAIIPIITRANQFAFIDERIIGHDDREVPSPRYNMKLRLTERKNAENVFP